MRCSHCGAANGDAASYCGRCGALWHVAAAAAKAARPMPVQSALSTSRPQPQRTALSGHAVQALQPGLTSGLPRVLHAAVAGMPRAMALSGTMAPPAQGSTGRRNWIAMSGWLGGGVLVCLALVLASQQAMQHMLPWLRDVISRDQPDPVPPYTPQADVVPAPAPVPSEAFNPHQLAQAINGELRRAGFGRVSVAVSNDRMAVASGRVDTAEEREEVLRWLGSLVEIKGVNHHIEVDVIANIAPAPVAPPALAPRTTPERERVAIPAPSVKPPAYQRAPVPPEPPIAPTPAPRVEPPVLPDAATVASAVQRELARLALANVTVEVSPSLEVTLRGTTNHAGRKAQAVAAARAAAPHGRVRDLIFVIEE